MRPIQPLCWIIILMLWTSQSSAYAQEVPVVEAPIQKAPVAESPAEPTLALASIFSDHMVLQRGQRVPIWGHAEPGTKVRLQLGDRVRDTTANDQGAWRLDVGPLAVGRPLEMRVWTEGAALNLDDIVVGDVWICSGQSNMQWTVNRSNDAEAEIANADWPQIRLVTLPRVSASSPQDRFKSAGWQICTSETIRQFSAVAYSFGRELRSTQNVPIGLISTNYGGTPMEAWTSRSALASRATFAREVKKADDAIGGDDRMLKGNYPTGLFNAMIHPLVPFGIRGAIWYQGESNAGRHQHYHELSQLMIADWRTRWGQGDFPFLLVQLAAFMPHVKQWPYLREAQHQTVLTEPNVAMAVATDIGDKEDIHPRNKQEVGKRLALAARALAYGEDIVYSGPVYEEMSKRNGTCVLSFTHLGSGLQIGRSGREEDSTALLGFEVAGKDRQFVPADARIEGDQVLVSSEAVIDPISVRYNWAGWTVGNLYNVEGLPAPPFRTDRF
ncbi:MAG: sialate O-acetylesterase [Planctomycetota bacterium]